jgi:type I restriction-modification system DNA methylase subunit
VIQSRFTHLLSLPEGENIGKAINEAMKAVEAENEDLKGVLPKTSTKIENSTLVSPFVRVIDIQSKLNITYPTAKSDLDIV